MRYSRICVREHRRAKAQGGEVGASQAHRGEDAVRGRTAPDAARDAACTPAPPARRRGLPGAPGTAPSAPSSVAASALKPTRPLSLIDPARLASGGPILGTAEQHARRTRGRVTPAPGRGRPPARSVLCQRQTRMSLSPSVRAEPYRPRRGAQPMTDGGMQGTAKRFVHHSDSPPPWLRGRNLGSQRNSRRTRRDGYAEKRVV